MTASQALPTSASHTGRNGPALIWPSRLKHPVRPPALVYLDLNHYIYLARAAAGDPTTPAGYTQLLEACRTARTDHRAVFPLSGPHYFEMSHIANPRQRHDVANIMEELSGYTVLLGRAMIAELEIDAALDAFLGTPPSGPSVPLLGLSCGWAFGVQGGLIVTDAEGNDITDQARARIGASHFYEMNRQMEYALLGGPTMLTCQPYARGYAPEKTFEIVEQRAKQQRDQVERLDTDPGWRRGRLRDLISAKELGWEVGDALTRVLMTRGTTTLATAIDGDRQQIRAFTDGMPSCRVAISLKTAYHRNARHRWTTNDIHDIDALAIAVPYCDAVFTDKAARNALTASPEIRALDTFLPRRPADLVDWVSAQPPHKLFAEL